MRTMNVLDHGYVGLVDNWGNEESIISAARMSTGGGFVSWEPYEGHANGDLGLLSYLYKHKHMTPFEMVGFTFEISAPIFVFREWHRHRTQSYNEASARYIPLPDLNFFPTYDRIKSGARKTKQAQGVNPLQETRIVDWEHAVNRAYRYAQEAYNLGLEIGIPKELARITVPVSRYSKMRASANLRNWLQFLELRLATNAQEEIRVYAFAVASFIATKCPNVWALFLGGNPYAKV